MNDFGIGRPPRPWNFYSSSDPSEPSPSQVVEDHRQGHWKNFGATSMNAISFGFVATALLISMFLIMAILEHLFRPSLSSSQDGVSRSLETNKSSTNDMEIRRTAAKEISVVMPGQKYPTCIAQPAPLVSCPRQGFRCPSHHPNPHPSLS
ncbi:uncharacterized protein LOC141643845 [Silene latifolia]|uniref:uncharacterized protein LOC141643845 n=1 Tax=Silene latifolia TaxID=37657 RepID=UPI003D789C34